MHSQDAPDADDRPEILAHVAVNVRDLRGERGLSQTALADRSGISRRMIVGIESGEANVSLSTLDRIAAALDVSFSRIVRSPDALDNQRIDSLAWQGKGVESRATLLGTAPAAKEAELWIWSLSPGDSYPAEADAATWHEMLYVVEGTLSVNFNGNQQQIKSGDFLIFSSDAPYSFVNEGAQTVRFVRNVIF